jgi:phage-related protein
MDFEVVFYKTAAGDSPVEEFLEEFSQTDPIDCSNILIGLKKLRNRKYHQAPLSKALEGGLFEMRHLGKINTRICYFFRRGRKIILVHAVRNKAQEFKRSDIEIAKKRMNDWIKRNPYNEN